MERLREKRVRIMPKAKVKEIVDDGVVFDRNGQEESVHGAEYVDSGHGGKVGQRPVLEPSRTRWPRSM